MQRQAPGQRNNGDGSCEFSALPSADSGSRLNGGGFILVMGWHRILFMRVIFAVSLLALLLAVPAWAGETKAKRTELDEKVDSGLAFLQRQQEADGSWGTSKGGARHTAITALSVMAFLSAGHVPGEGKYGETVEKGVRWVMKQQNQEGLLAADAAHEMYHHGICTLMLAEVAGMTEGDLGDAESAAQQGLRTARRWLALPRGPVPRPQYQRHQLHGLADPVPARRQGSRLRRAARGYRPRCRLRQALPAQLAGQGQRRCFSLPARQSHHVGARSEEHTSELQSPY